MSTKLDDLLAKVLIIVGAMGVLAVLAYEARAASLTYPVEAAREAPRDGRCEPYDAAGDDVRRRALVCRFGPVLIVYPAIPEGWGAIPTGAVRAGL